MLGKKRLGKTQEYIPAIGLGTWGIGGYELPDYSNDEYYIEFLKSAINEGFTLIDTAEMYGGGHTEELIGRVFQELQKDDVFIISKVWPTNLKWDRMLRSVRSSLQRLGVGVIDLYLIHWPSSFVDSGEAIRNMEKLVKLGYVRYIGVSNYPPDLIEEALSELRSEEIVANEVKYSLYDRHNEETLQYCQKMGITFIAYTPIEKGRVANDAFLKEIGRKYGKSAIQVALNWLVLQDRVVAIPKTSNLTHLLEIKGSVGWELSKDDFNLIDEKYAVFRHR